jgi:hypothetical protein
MDCMARVAGQPRYRRGVPTNGHQNISSSPDTVPVIIDRLTGKVRAAQIFVAVMGASNFTYAEASWTQALADWIGAHTRAFATLGGVPKLLVPWANRHLPRAPLRRS